MFPDAPSSSPRGPVAAGIARIDRSAIDDRRGPRRIIVDFDHASAHTVPVGGNADDRDVLTRTRRVAVAVLVCSIALSACSPSGPESVSPPTAASPVNSLPVTPSPTLALATPSPLPGGAITTYAGRDFSGDGGPATAARLLAPAGVALDPAGNLYIADTADHRIRKVTPGGTISTYAGSGNFGFSGDGGPATAAELNFPRDVALDPAGNLYIADSGNSRIRKVSPGGTISTYAGSGSRGFSGDGGPAAAAQLNNPVGMALDPAGNLYIADITNNRIRKVTSGGTISTYAGSGSFGFSGDGGPATDAQLGVPVGVALDPAGNLYIADHDNGRIRKVTSGGTISTYAGSGSRGLSGDGGPATAAQLYSPHGVALDTAGNLYIADSNRIRKVTPGGTISTYAGTGTGPFSGDGGPATAAQLSSPAGVALDLTGNLYIADDGNYRIRKVTPGGTISTYAGGGSSNFSGDGGPATAAQLNVPVGVALDPAGNLYIADQGNSRIRKVTPGGTISTYAGTDTPGFSGDGGPATAAQLNVPVGVAVDPAGNLYIADSGSSRIRKVGPGGTISTYAGGGGGTPGFLGDGGPATAAYLNNPVGVTLDPAGNLYIADLGNARVRKVTPGGTISTYAGSGSFGFSGDGGPATAAQLNGPWGVAVDPAGILYIAESGRIRKVTTGGTISTYAGSGNFRFAGDGGPATAAELNFPRGMGLDPAGNLYIADKDNARIRKVTSGGTISTYAGSGSRGFLGDGGPATAARFREPSGVALDPAGNLYIADTYNNRIRKVTPTVAVSTTPAPTASASLAAAPPPNIRTTPLGQVTGNWLFYGVQIPRPERDRIEIQIIAVPASGGAATIVVAFDAATARGGANGVFTVGIFDSAPYLRRQFSPDGRRMVFSIGGELVVIDFVTGQAKPLGVRGFYPSWSRDGSQIAFVFEKPVADAGANRSHAIGVVPVAGGSPRELVASSQDTSVEWSPDGSRILSPIPVVDCVDCPPVHATMEVTTGRIGMRFAFVSGGPSYSHWRTGSPELAIAIEVCGEIATPVSRIVGIDERTRSERILVDVAEPCPERDGRLEAVQLRDPRWNPAVADELLYVMARGNDFETHVVNIATGKDTRLPISAYEATWTRDGSAVAYLVKDPGSSFGSAVRVWKRDGSGETEIRRATGGEAVFSIASVSY